MEISLFNWNDHPKHIAPPSKWRRGDVDILSFSRRTIRFTACPGAAPRPDEDSVKCWKGREIDSGRSSVI